MGKFDDILLVTDLDGTLAVGKDIDKRNVEAIEYFKANGGKFTICTGRVWSYLKDIIDICTPNTYLISLNGAVILDVKTEQYLYKGYLPLNYLKMTDAILEYSSDIDNVFVYFDNHSTSTVYTPDELKNAEAITDAKTKIHKVVFSFKDENTAIQAVKNANNLCLPELVCVRSWPTGVEILNKNASKGASVIRVKEQISAKKLIAVGDFENDISMLKAADIGYAVANSIDAVKLCADRITAPVTDASLAAVISELDCSL